MRLSYFLLFCLMGSLQCCTDEVPVTIVHTGLVREITDEGVLFTGSIQGSGKEEILEYGFVWSTGDDPNLLNSHYKVGEGSFKGEFKQQVRSNLSNNTEYKVWAYVKTSNNDIFGEAIKFKSQGVAGPVIASFEPNSGSSNDLFTIVGSNFSQQLGSNVVKVGSVLCTTVASSDKEIQVKLPDGITNSGKFKVSVKIGDVTTFSEDDFTLEGPIISAVNPISAIQGTIVTIDGEGFSSVFSENTVKFGQTVSQVIEASTNRLLVLVPPTNFAGTVPLTVTVDGITGESKSQFTIEGPEIYTTNPSQGYPGKILTINGKNFSAVISENIVFIGGLTSKILEATTSELKVEIPFGLSINPGYSVDVKVTVTQKSFTKTSAFVTLSPWSNVAEFPGAARTHAASFVIGDKGYIATGTFSANCACYLSDFWTFDPLTNSWAKNADFPGAKRYYAVGFSVGGKGYITGGYTPSGPSNDVWEYNPSLNQWTKKNDLYSISSQYAKVLTINDKAYLINGSALYVYDAVVDQWNTLTGFPGPSSGPPYPVIAFAINGKAYKSGDGKEFYEYDPLLDKWTRKADIPLPNGGFGFVSFSLDGKGYIGSGKYYVNFLDSYSFYRYDPISDNWEQVPSTHYSVQNASTFVINGNAYYGIGNAGDFVQKSFVKFNPNY